MLVVKNIRTEYKINPIGVPLNGVRFSWEVESSSFNQSQIAYHVIVKKGDRVVWDSGKVLSSKTNGIMCLGEPLVARTEYSWQVKVYSEKEESDFSLPQTFETTLSNKEWDSAYFIGAKSDELPLIRKSFSLPNKKILKARVYACGLGSYNLFLNGKRVNEELLNPLITRYHINYFYNVYDITSMLNSGENVFGAELGRGYYSMNSNGVEWQKENWKNAEWRDQPKCKIIAFITLEDGEICIYTDESWQITKSPLIVDEAYYGEEYDARILQDGWNNIGFNAEKWESAKILAAPKGKAIPQLAEGSIIEKTLPLKELYHSDSEILFIAEEMTTGWAKLVVEGNLGDEIEISYSEWLDENGKLDLKGLLSVWSFQGRERKPQTDYFILKGGKEEIIAPLFQYKGFRYVRVRVKGNVQIKSATIEVVRAGLEQKGNFECSSSFLNDLHYACKNSLLCNLHSYPSDTPVYEKLGYLADGYLTQEMAHYNYDAIKYYEKWAWDIIYQAKENGYIEQTAPMWDEDKENAPEWSVGILTVPYQIYKLTNDKTLLLACYEKAKKVFEYQMSLTDGYIANSMWGDHLPTNHKYIKHISATSALYNMACNLVETAMLQGKEEDAKVYSLYAKHIKEAFNTRFYNEEKGFYCEDSEEFTLNAQIIPYAVGLVDSQKLSSIEKAIMTTTKIDGGIFGLKSAFLVYNQLGLQNKLYEFVTKKEEPSFYNWLATGDKSLWEQWQEEHSRSKNHHMFGVVDGWLYKTVAGIEIVDGKTLKIAPYFAKDLSWAKGEVSLPSGKASVSWRRERGGIMVEVKIPFNVKAEVQLGKDVLKIGSGEYQFKA